MPKCPCIISRTGYTGERGYEIMVARDLAPWVWDALLTAGRPLGIVPQGVAARESLRTEAGYLLNGNDMDARNQPVSKRASDGWSSCRRTSSAGMRWHGSRRTGVRRKMVGLEVEGPRTIRNGYPIYRMARRTGRVTSGPLSAA